eukprot:scaffold1474_cov229-Prasinococcus_capsulatus_cf.AAC.2
MNSQGAFVLMVRPRARVCACERATLAAVLMVNAGAGGQVWVRVKEEHAEEFVRRFAAVAAYCAQHEPLTLAYEVRVTCTAAAAAARATRCCARSRADAWA